MDNVEVADYLVVQRHQEHPAEEVMPKTDDAELPAGESSRQDHDQQDHDQGVIVTFTDAELAYLSAQRLGRLATSRSDGTLQASPVGFAYNPAVGCIDIGGHNMAASAKFRNVADNGRAAFVVDDIASINPWEVRCLEVRGYAEALTEPDDSAAPVGGAIIRIHPRRIISFGIDPGNPASGKRDVPADPVPN